MRMKTDECIDFSGLRALEERVQVLESAVDEAARIQARIDELKRQGCVPIGEYRKLQRLLDAT